MQLIKMNYKDFEFCVNAKSLKFEYSKNIATHTLPQFNDKVQEVSQLPTMIYGTGYLTDCTGSDTSNSIDVQMQQLTQVFKSKGDGYLFCPGYQPIKAYFKDLSFSRNAKDNALSYSFVFVESSVNKELCYDLGYTFATEGENLFDVANRLDVAVDVLVDKNDYATAFDVKEGDKIYYA